ncbi:MAG: FtsW/RodA/SpoVE family cell cycle protein, partial [Oligoflexia bacterium]|nr:FtsW/RodA/SpoVE family cell cycle protein [Oligoflexia bacterium]
MQSTLVSFLKKYDFTFFTLMFLIFIIGVLNLYSATHAVTDKSVITLYKSQLLWFIISITVGVVVSFIRPKTLFRYSYLFYAINLILVVLVLIVGVKALGGRRWLDFGPIRIQPSEMMKISLVLMLGRWYSSKNPEVDVTMKDMLIPGIFALIPAIFVIV